MSKHSKSVIDQYLLIRAWWCLQVLQENVKKWTTANYHWTQSTDETVMGMSLALQLSSHKGNYWKDYNFGPDLVTVWVTKRSQILFAVKQLETQMWTIVTQIHPLGTMNARSWWADRPSFPFIEPLSFTSFKTIHFQLNQQNVLYKPMSQNIQVEHSAHTPLKIWDTCKALWILAEQPAH